MRRKSVSRLRWVSLSLAFILAFYALGPMPALRPTAYAAEDPPPLPVPDDPLAAQPEGQQPEMSVSVDTRDGHLTVRIVDAWGPGKTPLLYRTANNTTGAADISAAGSWHLNQILEVRHTQGATSLLLRDADGTISSYKGSGAQPCQPASRPGVIVFERTVGPCSTIETTQYTLIRQGEEQTYWSGIYTQYLPKGGTRKFVGPAFRADIIVGDPITALAGITEEKDANGNTRTFAWALPAADAYRPYLQTATDEIGRVTTYAYERGQCAETAEGPRSAPQGAIPLLACLTWFYRVKTITDPYGRTVTFTYNTSGDVTQVVNAAGRTSTYTYLTARHPASVQDPLGRTYAFTWGIGTRIFRVTAPDGTATNYAYNDSTRQTTVTDARGYATVYTYSYYNPAAETGGDLLSVTDPLAGVTAYTYDTKHNVTQGTNPRGIRTTYQYNSRNKVTQVVQDAGGLNLTSTLTWDSNDNLLTVTSPRGITSAYQYDVKHNLTRVTKAQGTPAQAVTQYTYTTWGGVASVIDPRGNTTTFTYDTRRRLTTVAPPAGGTTTYGYDTLDNRTSMTNGSGRTWTYAYDTPRNLLTETDPLSNRTTYQYDAVGNHTRVTDPKNYATTFTYDSRDRITAITDPLSQSTTYAYDAVGNLTRITNARGSATTFAYDAIGRLSAVTDALTQTTTYQYDAAGNRTRMVDRKGQTFSYTYDTLNRLTQVQVGTTTFSYTYDAAGNRLTLVDGTGTTTFQYDDLDRLTRITYPDTKTVQYAYDAAGNRTSLTNPGNVTFTYTYDAANRLTGITQGSRTWTFGYDAAGNRTSLNHPNGAKILYTYLTNNWLGTITHKRSGNVTFDTITYAYDPNGNRTTLTDYTGTTAFGYDALNRLTSAAYPRTYGTWSWTYDAVGNRLTQNSPSGQATYGYDANNRLTSGGGKTYSYDANGNLTSISGGTTFTYDAHNRLSQANLPGGLTVQYTYNGDGLKIRRIEGSAATRYYHDGIRPIYETDEAGSLQAQLERDIFGNLLARKTSGGTWYHHHDGLGSTVGLTDASGAVSAQRTYDAWGNRRTSSGAAPGNYQFTGAELDPTSGLYHMGARFYDPTVGRWLSEDPRVPDFFDPSTLSFYAYTRNNPASFVDPRGTAEESTDPGGGNNPQAQARKLLQEIARILGITVEQLVRLWESFRSWVEANQSLFGPSGAILAAVSASIGIVVAAGAGGPITQQQITVLNRVASAAGFAGATAATLGAFAKMSHGKLSGFDVLNSAAAWGSVALVGPMRIAQIAGQQSPYSAKDALTLVGHIARTAWGIIALSFGWR